MKLNDCKDILHNVRKEADIKSPYTGSFLELDIWIKRHNICFEFQDAYHYTTTWYSHGTLDQVQQNDSAKLDLVRKKGITLIVVPYWWDGSHASLIATIKFQRPDLLNIDVSSTLIPLNPASIKVEIIPEVGSLMPASFPPEMPRVNREHTWWMGEKYDGVRFCWHPIRENLYPIIWAYTLFEVDSFGYTRNGVEIPLPDELYDEMPYVFLDGELWFGRGNFLDSQKVVNSSDSAEWQYLRAVVFDDPDPKTHLQPFEDRYKHIFDNVRSDHPLVISAIVRVNLYNVAPRISCNTNKLLSKALQHVITDGGEGLILREPKSLYEQLRSTSLYKLKASRGDSEALVITKGDTILLKVPDDTTFEAEQITGVDCKVGDVVTFAYDRYSQREVPVNPEIVRVRDDLSWEDVVRNFYESIPQSNVLTDSTWKVFGDSSKPRGFWNENQKARIRSFMEKFAQDNNFDPAVPSNWYSVSAKFYKYKGSKSVLAHFKNSFAKAVMETFPNIGLKEYKFQFLQRNYWEDMQNQRQVFNNFAKSMEFDPLVPDNWYFVTYLDVLQENKNARSVLALHGKSLVNTVTHVYPDIGLDPAKFVTKRYYLLDFMQRRKLFLDFAKHEGFDPFEWKNWRRIKLDALLAFKGIAPIIFQYRGNVKAALANHFHEMKPDLEPKPNLSSMWNDPEARRDALLEFAESKEFDMVAVARQFKQMKGSWEIAKLYKGNIVKCLADAFPDKVTESEFLNATSEQWKNKSARRSFFDSFADDHGFDPLIANNWYSVNPQMLADYKGINALLSMHGGSVASAVIDAYPTIKLERLQFVSSAGDRWRDVNNRREFFENFAAKKGFDPLIAENWYTFTREDILAEKSSLLVLQYYQGSFVKALADVFPDIGLDQKQFEYVSVGYWLNPATRKAFFDDVAKQNNFDPLVPDNWYKIPAEQILSAKHAGSLLQYYGGSYKNALMEVYPEIGLQATNFDSVPRGYWANKTNQRQLFDTFANQNNFDPLNAENWHKADLDLFWSQKGAKAVLKHYKNNVFLALRELYPNVNLGGDEFHFNQRNWKVTKNRKLFFDAFAKDRGFDPLLPQNWYNITTPDILERKHARSVLRFHQESFKRAVIDLYPEIGIDINKFVSKSAAVVK